MASAIELPSFFGIYKSYAMNIRRGFGCVVASAILTLLNLPVGLLNQSI